MDDVRDWTREKEARRRFLEREIRLFDAKADYIYGRGENRSA